jgi:hypothetical protein
MHYKNENRIIVNLENKEERERKMVGTNAMPWDAMRKNKIKEWLSKNDQKAAHDGDMKVKHYMELFSAVSPKPGENKT